MKSSPVMDKARTACFSGHRPEKIPFKLLPGNPDYINLQHKIGLEVLKAAREGYDHFLCGMAMGFDLICGGLILTIREDWLERYGHLKLSAVMPFAGHGFKGFWGQVHREVLNGADQALVLGDLPGPKAFYLRNRFMVERSSLLIAYGRCPRSGTAQTMRLAERQGLNIINLAQEELN